MFCLPGRLWPFRWDNKTSIIDDQICSPHLKGLILALALSRNGVPVRIIEKRSSYPIGQRGAGM
ncbi:hypothetical protein L218DRAFT_887518, partial [Marasmius fiardii PR-910]